MLQRLSEKIRRSVAAVQTMLPWARTIGLTIAVGIAYFVAAQLSLALLAEADGIARFWPAAGVSTGVLIALGRDARLPVACGVYKLFHSPTASIWSTWQHWFASDIVDIITVAPLVIGLAARCRPGFAAAAVFIVSLAIIWAITFGSSHFRILAIPTRSSSMRSTAAFNRLQPLTRY